VAPRTLLGHVATTTDLDAVITDSSVDLVDICLPTRLHADVAVRAMQAGSPPYAAMLDHVLACLAGHAGNLIEPASVLPALELTLDVHQRLTQPAQPTREGP
jgi:hypothetical protein